MGICSATVAYSGQLVFQIDRAYFEAGNYAGSVIIKAATTGDAKYVFVNLIGIESISSKSINNQKEFLSNNLFLSKLERQSNSHQLDFTKVVQNNFRFIRSNYCKVQNVSLSTTVYLECYLTKSNTADSQSNSILPNSRRIHLLKINQPQQQFKSIVLQYNPAAPGFSPIVSFHADRNIFHVGEQIKGVLTIDNTQSQYPLIKNQFLIVQKIELMPKNSQEMKLLPSQIMISQMLDTLQCENRTMHIDVPINLAFKDAASYLGQIYRITYCIQIELTWEEKELIVMQEIIYIFDQNI